MKRVFFVCAAVLGLLLVTLTYERLFVEKTFGPAAAVALGALALLVSAFFASGVLFATRFRHLVGNAWLMVLSVSLTYVIVDLTAGYLLIEPLSPPLEPDLYRHHRLVPNSNARFDQRDFSYVQRVNNLGMRGVDRSIEKATQTIRVVTLGDSFTMGKGVADDETYPVGVERILNERLTDCGARLRVEVLNGGVDSYAPILSYIQLKRDIAPLKPDLVIHALDVSDLVQEAAYRAIAEYSADGDVVAVPQRDPRRATLTDRARTWVERHMFLTRLALYYANRAFGFKDLSVHDVVTQANFEVAAHTLQGDRENRDAQWVGLLDSVRKLRDYSERIGAKYVLVTYPWGHQVNEGEWIPGRYVFMPEGSRPSDTSLRRISAFADDNSIQHVDLLAAFRAYSGESPLYLKHDPHMTATGYRLMAQGITEFLAARYLAGWCGP